MLFTSNSSGILDTIAAESVNVALWTSIMNVGVDLREIFVDHDARMHISPDHALPELIEAHRRSKFLTNLLLGASICSGALGYYHSKDQYWLLGSTFMLTSIPYCVLVEYPVIDQLKHLTLEAKSPQARSLMNSWNGIQYTKLALASMGAVIFYWFARR